MTYIYQEYPKWINRNGKDIVVNSKEEEFGDIEIEEQEEEILVAANENPDGFGENLGNKDAYKLRLKEQAQLLGIQVKGTWGIDKIKKAINDHAA